MTRLSQQIEQRNSLLWLDYVDYGVRLLVGGTAPWCDTAASINWYRRMQGLLPSDVVTAPLARYCSSWVDSHPELLAAMTTNNPCCVQPLRVLLSDDRLRAHLNDLVTAMRASFPQGILAVTVPSPRRWLSECRNWVPDTEVPDCDDDDVDAAAAEVADLLRVFAAVEVDVLSMEESTESVPGNQDAFDLYRPVLNVTSHYRWETGMRLPDGVLQPDCFEELKFVVASAPTNCPIPIHIVAENWWYEQVPSNTRPQSNVFAVVPFSMAPESVLERLALLR